MHFLDGVTRRIFGRKSHGLLLNGTNTQLDAEIEPLGREHAKERGELRRLVSGTDDKFARQEVKFSDDVP